MRIQRFRIGRERLFFIALSFMVALSGCRKKGGGSSEDADTPDEQTDNGDNGDGGGTTVADAVAITSPVDGTVINPNNDSTSFTVSGTCAPDGEDSVALSLGGNALSTHDCASGAWSSTIDTTALSNGDYDLSAAVGDANATATLTKNVPNPQISLDDISDINAFNQSALPITGSCSPDGSSISIDLSTLTDAATVQCGASTSGTFAAAIDGSSLTDDTGLQVSATLDAGFGLTANDTDLINKDTSVSLSLNTLGTVTSSNVSAYTFSGTCIPDTASITIDFGGLAPEPTAVCGASSSGQWSVTADLSAAADADSIDVDVTLDNGVGGSTMVSDVVQKDATLPTITISSSPAVNAANQTVWNVGGACTDDGDTITIDFGGLTAVGTVTCGTTVSGQWTAALDVSAQADGGAIDLTATVDDTFNPTASATVSVAKDTTLAAIAIGSAPIINDANKTTYTVTGTCYPDTAAIDLDVGALVDVASTTCGASVSGTYSMTADVSAEADASLVTVSVDIDDTVTQDVETSDVLKDTVVPSITIDPTSDINNSNVSAYTFSGSCDDATATVTLSIGAFEQDLSCDGMNWTVTDNYSAIADGSGMVATITIEDAAANSASDNDTFDKDATLPFDATGWGMDPVSGTTSTDITPIVFGSGYTNEEGTVVRLYEEGTCSTQVDSATVASGSFVLNGNTYATDGSDSGLHHYYAEVTDALGNVRPCFDTGLSYTLEGAGLATQPLLALLGDGDDNATVVVLEDGTQFDYESADGMTTTSYGTPVTPAGTMFVIPNTSQGDKLIVTDGAAMAMTRIGAIALPWATDGYAGKKFIYNVRSGQATAKVIIAAGAEDAIVNITLTDGQTANPTVLANTVHEETLSGLVAETGVVITSDKNIVVGAYSGTSVDNMLLSAVGLDMISVGYVRAVEDNTTVDVYYGHGPVSENQLIATSGGSQVAGDLLNSNPIASQAARVLSDKPVSGYHRADGDGTDAVSGINVDYLATHYALPEDSDYIVAVALQSGTVTVREPGESARVLNMIRDGSAHANAPYYVGDGLDLDAGTLLECSVPCAIVYDSLAQGDEEFLLGYTP